MTENQAFGILEPHLNRLAACVVKAFENYRTRYPHRPIHRRTAVANVLCDEIWAEAVNAFDEIAPLVRPIPHIYGTRYLGVQGPKGEIEILLWFKMVDGQGRPRSYPTSRAKRMLSGKNLELFEKATVLVVGHHLNKEETRIVSVSVGPPSSRRREWCIDLTLPANNIVEISETASQAAPGRRVVVRRIRQDRLGNDSKS